MSLHTRAERWRPYAALKQNTHDCRVHTTTQHNHYTAVKWRKRGSNKNVTSLNKVAQNVAKLASNRGEVMTPISR